MEDSGKISYTGQLQRVCIALALACGASVLVAGEPATALDAVTQLKVLATLRTWAAEGRSLLLITYDPTAAAALCTRAIVMEAAGSWSRHPWLSCSKTRNTPTRPAW
ncbi:hypothetical protein C3B78_17855 [Arthrobacter sp. PGP41]|uniref:hypothetical protein n=1 Tax=Arthrobacter sp. PGP41 TaxID=2079227 RepID=UPI000CDC2392|nr:hypothetical protein [Arthrobacter sp. PGP41]AUZ36124.1 hypothetical protein C3B78_17855 [Arthrobacter sp. PGP41]